MSKTPTYKTGDDWFIRGTLKDSDKVPYADLATATSVKLIILDDDDDTANIVVAAIEQTVPSAEWSNGAFTFIVPRATTTNITFFGLAYVDVQVTDAEGYKQTWPRRVIRINKGYIT